MPRRPAPQGLRIRLVLGGGRMIGPGQAELLGLIGETGSIAAAGRRMGMSYKRAWSLVERMNATFREPLVETARGGAAHGGAALTATGTTILDAYRRLVAEAEQAGAADIAAIRSALAPGGD